MTVHLLNPETGEYEDTGRPAELHPFDPAASSDACLHRMAEGYICGSPKNSPIHSE